MKQKGVEETTRQVNGMWTQIKHLVKTLNAKRTCIAQPTLAANEYDIPAFVFSSVGVVTALRKQWAILYIFYNIYLELFFG